MDLESVKTPMLIYYREKNRRNNMNVKTERKQLLLLTQLHVYIYGTTMYHLDYVKYIPLNVFN